MAQPLDDAQYARLLSFRRALRRFERWSERRAAEAGLTAAQHQLLLAVRALGGPGGPTVGDVAEALFVRHHSAVELIDRAARAGLVTRRRDTEDGRLVRLALTRRGRDRLTALAAVHVEELRRLAPLLGELVEPADPRTTA
ncbi:MAG: MarR family transcriptional regulator [Actinobacteria bacterium]|nr:MarR family transcriptional regulator [Actinomycetota bacterium]